MECLKDKNFAIVDVETSGTDLSARVIEIGILRIEEGTCVDTYRTLVNPGHALPHWITELTGITTEEVSRAPYFDDVIDDIERLLADAIFVAHNVPFDYAFIEREFARRARIFSSPRLCTARLSRSLFPHFRRHSLAHLIARHGLFVVERHRAFDDAYALWQFLQLCKDHPRFEHAVESLIKTPFREPLPDDDGEIVIR